MRIILIFLIFPCLVFSQSSNDGTRLFSLLYVKGYPTKSRQDISFKDKYQGVVFFKNDSIKSEFNLKNSYLIDNDNKIDLYDKNLKYFELIYKDNQTLKVKRIDFDDKLKRVLIDTTNFIAYDTNLDFSSKKISKKNIIFNYNEKYYKVKRNIFRSFKKNLEKTINNIEIKDKNLEKFILDYFLEVD